MFQAILKMLSKNVPPAPMPPRDMPRHPLNVPGDFYVVDGECLTTGLAEGEAPDLVASCEEVSHCYYKKQPTTPEELEQAIMAVRVSCTDCHRYGGTDPAILRRLKALKLEAQCDHPLPPNG